MSQAIGLHPDDPSRDIASHGRRNITLARQRAQCCRKHQFIFRLGKGPMALVANVLDYNDPAHIIIICHFQAKRYRFCMAIS